MKNDPELPSCSSSLRLCSKLYYFSFERGEESFLWGLSGGTNLAGVAGVAKRV